MAERSTPYPRVQPSIVPPTSYQIDQGFGLPKSAMFEDLGVTGLEYYGNTSLIYDEIIPNLKGVPWRQTRIFQEMATNDSTVSSILFAVEQLCRQVKWAIQPYSDTVEDIDMANFVESCMHDMSSSWDDTMSEVLSMITYGWSFHEIIYKRRLGPDQEDASKRSQYRDGRIGWRKLPVRGQETLYNWQFDDNGGIVGFWQLGPPTYRLTYIPIEKALLFRTKVRKNNPQGVSVLRGAYRSWFLKKRIEEVEGIGIERDLAGMPIAWVPPQLLASDATPEQKNLLAQIKNIVVNIRRDEQEGVIFPLVQNENGAKLYDLTLMSTGGRRQFDTDAIIRRYDSRIAMTVLADIILMGQERIGSYALATTKTELFSTAIGSWLDSIAAVFNRYAIPRLMKMNGYDVNRQPYLTHGQIFIPDLKELSAYLTTLSGVGIDLSGLEMDRYLKEVAHLPVSMDDILGAPGIRRPRSQGAQKPEGDLENGSIGAGE